MPTGSKSRVRSIQEEEYFSASHTQRAEGPTQGLKGFRRPRSGSLWAAPQDRGEGGAPQTSAGLLKHSAHSVAIAPGVRFSPATTTY